MRPIGRPPSAAPRNLPELTNVQPRTLWRLHWESDILAPPTHTKGKFRFDAPLGQYNVAYACESDLAVFAEVYGDRAQIPVADRHRRYSAMLPKRPLQLLDLHEPRVTAALRIDTRLCTEPHYARARAWSAAFHSWYPEADGLRYIGRHSGGYLNYALFLDRCAPAFSIQPLGQLRDLRRLVQHAASTYSLAPLIFTRGVSTRPWP